MSEPLLSVRDLRTQFFTREGVVHAVDGVSFDVHKGRTLGIVGESGCGKTVTALSIIGLLPTPPARIVGGEVLFEGRDLTKLPERQLEDVRGREIAMIFQDPMTSLNPTLTIGMQITETIRRHSGVSKRVARLCAIELLSERRNRLLPERRRRGRDVDQVAVVRDDRRHAGFLDAAAEAGDLVGRQRTRPPLSRGLREDLQRLASRRLGAIHGTRQAAGDRQVRAEPRHQSPNTSASKR